MTRPRSRFLQLPWRSRARIARDVDDELAFHLEMRVHALTERGMGADEARRRARAEFGDLERTRRYCRDVDTRADRAMRIADHLAAWRQDARYAVRTLRRSPGFTLVSLITLALAIGATTAIVSVARAVLLAPLPYGDPGALVAVSDSLAQNAGERLPLAPPNFADYQAEQRSLTGLAAYNGQLATWRPKDGDPQIVSTLAVTANLFDVLRVGAWRGRTFVTGDDAPSAGAAVVLSYGFWQRAFGGNAGVVGSTITLYNQPYNVIGIMPRGFTVRGDEDLWVPLDLSGDLARPATTRKQRYLKVIARLRPGVSLAAARADIRAISRRLQAEYPEANADRVTTLLPLHAALDSSLKRPVLLLLAGAVFVLLIACANLANVTLSRTTSRNTEIAVRAALGAGRARLARQLLTESVMLSLFGGALGVALALVATRTLLALNPGALPPMFTVGIDRRALLFSLFLSVGTGVLFGMVPALGAARADLHDSLKEGGRGSGHSGGRTGQRVRRALVVTQVGLAVVLLVGAGLLIRSFHDLMHVQLGFDPDRVLTAQLRADGPAYDSTAAVNRFYDRVIAEIAAAPGVEAAGAMMVLPMQGKVFSGMIVEGQPVDPDHVPDIGYTLVRGDVFKALRIPIVAGRSFNDTDTPDGAKTTIINEAAARRYFPNGDAVGHRVHIGPNPDSPWVTVIGVVGTVRDAALDVAPVPTIYGNSRQETWWRTLSVVVRTRGNPQSAVSVIRRAVTGADPTVAVRDVQTLDQVIGSSVASRRFALALASCFAGLALLLAAVGVYGVLAYSVTGRRREFGVRLALGASARSVVLLVLRQGLTWSLLGMALGLAAALLGARLLRGMLYGVGPLDASTYISVLLVAVVVVVAACLVPAARATRVDPLTSMRVE